MTDDAGDAMAAPNKQILIPSSGMLASKKKAVQMVSFIESGAFWHTLAWCGFIKLNIAALSNLLSPQT